LIAATDDLGRIEVAEGLRTPCCGVPLSPQQVTRKEDEIEIVCPGCHRTVLRIDVPAPDWYYD